MLTDSDIAGFRAVMRSILPDVCDVLRAVDTPDNFGGQSRTWQAVVSAVACRVAPDNRTPTESEAGGRTAGVSYTMITLPAGTDVTERDRIAVTGGKTYEVLGVVQRQRWELSRRVRCLLVT